MKKVFLVLALAGMVGSVSAATVSAVVNKNNIVSVNGEKKEKKAKKKKKSCCSADGSGCSKDKAKPAEAPKAQ
jgi:hypothetical protein